MMVYGCHCECPQIKKFCVFWIKRHSLKKKENASYAYKVFPQPTKQCLKQHTPVGKGEPWAQAMLLLPQTHLHPTLILSSDTYSHAFLIPEPLQCPLELLSHGEQCPFNCSLGAGSVPFFSCFLWAPSSPPTPLLSDFQSLERENLCPPYPSKTLLVFYRHVNSSFSSYATWLPTTTPDLPLASW